MNGQFMELWGSWLTNALRSQNHLDMMGGWWLRSIREWSSFGRPYSMPWGIPSTQPYESGIVDAWQQVWKSLSGIQQLYMQWVQVVPQHKYDQLEKRAEELEAKVREQAKTIDRLRNLLSKSGGENDMVISQLQDLIGQQSEQFKQMTQSVGEYIKSSTRKASAKK
jgi:uncharacterized coiled-coil protein SlyX